MLPPKRPTFTNHPCPERRYRRPPKEQTTSERGYDTTWQKLREAKLGEMPFCESIICQKCQGLVDEKAGFKCSRCGLIQEMATLRQCLKPACQVDHFIPIHAAPGKRLDPENLRSICARHNSQKSHLDKIHHPRSGRG